jgi:hypothetical protein
MKDGEICIHKVAQPDLFSFLFQSIPLLLHSQKSSLLEIIYWEFRVKPER